MSIGNEIILKVGSKNIEAGQFIGLSTAGLLQPLRNGKKPIGVAAHLLRKGRLVRCKFPSIWYDPMMVNPFLTEITMSYFHEKDFK